ncbi:hypothetical protein HXX76_005043 [Chlamydomonas incerta]|uniref:Uncharacterized protein n=1 Tax=Chlamydomonas incerta TaxID=51695 RepID=A0A835W2T7_CHLIN|nr:hypothetical protein HXX76_005043 [Chlamydomonas incerta]|eukprot:KAG2438492.1 hypothetical protein HXX76_005043 [Chlamydomonas incerta]
MSSDPLARARGAVESLLGPAGARKFDDNDLLRLKNAGYESLEDLVAATPAGLARAELRPARADLIIRAQASTAGLGVGTASGAAASAANQGAVPLLGTDGPSDDAPAPGLKDRFPAAAITFILVVCAGGVLALMAK